MYFPSTVRVVPRERIKMFIGERSIQSVIERHSRNKLKLYSGYLQADAYSGFDVLCREGRIIEVAYLAHCRRNYLKLPRRRRCNVVASQLPQQFQ